MQRQDRDTFGARQSWNAYPPQKETYDSWGKTEIAKLDMVYEANHNKREAQNEKRERSRSRSRSRDREHFSESVWDRAEVEGPPSSGSEREKDKEKREKVYEYRQMERERESSKVYQPIAPKSIAPEKKENRQPQHSPSPTSGSQMATFKTHMAQKAKEKERKVSGSTMVSNNTDRHFDNDISDDWPAFTAPVIPAPVLAPPSLKNPASACLTYNRVPWKLRVRKEVFRPNEPIGPPAAIDLLFAQIAADVFGVTSTLRINPQERRAALNLLEGHGVNVENMNGQVRAIVKRHLIDMARGWMFYFSRIFVVSGSPQLPDISLLAVSHNGVCLAKRNTEHFIMIRSIPFAELHGVSLPRPAALQLSLPNGNRVTLYAPRAAAIQNMIQLFCNDYKQVSGILFQQIQGFTENLKYF